MRTEPSTRNPERAGGAGLLLVSAVHNEARHLRRVAAAIASQSSRPDAWVVVDDSSTDGSLAILRELEAELDFLRVLEAPERDGGAAPRRDRLADALEARAFNRALEAVPWRRFDYIGKLDGDIELPADYFERLLAEFGRDRSLGVAGGSIEERSHDRWRLVRIPDYHVHGAVKTYTRECFEAVDGVQERLGWDTIDETYARMLGFRTRSLGDLVARHHRPSATADGVLRGRARHGRCAYIVRYSLPWVILRSAKVATARPLGLSGIAFLYGYLSAALSRAPRVEDEHFKRFVRRELRRRLAGPLPSLLRLLRSTPRATRARD